jgi:4-aminobutyrate aminotransferase-like enzyme
MANGHPVGGVVAGADKIAAFRQGYRYFNTFGGNPVSCAAANAVLEEMRSAQLQQNADSVGSYARARLTALQDKFEVIGDVRGSGLIFGTEFILDRATKEPARAYADQVVNEMRRQGIILSKLGRHKNTLKIRPPMPFSKQNADQLVDTLEDVLHRIPVS